MTVAWSSQLNVDRQWLIYEVLIVFGYAKDDRHLLVHVIRLKFGGLLPDHLTVLLLKELHLNVVLCDTVAQQNDLLTAQNGSRTVAESYDVQIRHRLLIVDWIRDDRLQWHVELFTFIALYEDLETQSNYI